MEKFKELRPSIAAFALMVAMALTTTALSFFIGPVCEELGLGRGSFTIYYSLMTASGAFSIPFHGQIINKKGVRSILTVSAFWIAAGFFGFSLSTKLWMFYAVAAFMGIFGTSFLSLCANVIVQQAYSSVRASSLLGLVMSGSGVGGMILSMVMPGFIENFGWRTGYRLLGICWLVLVLGALLLGNIQPIGSVGKRHTSVDGMTRDEAMKSPKLYLLVAVIFILSAACGIQQQIPSVLGGFGYGTAQVSTMMSFFTAALAVGKILQGILYSRLGPARGGYIIIAVFGLSFVLLCFPGMAYPALVALAVGMGCVTTLMPIVTRFVFGAREYAAIWSILSTASSIGTLIATPLFGMAYDATGSYTPAMAVSAGALFVSIPILAMAFKKK